MSGSLSLGANDRFADTIRNAAERTGIPAAALAAIVDAESAKGPGGIWNVQSRNPRSSAAGLGQFLSGTWVSEAERKGSWLNGIARANGWLDGSGRVEPAHRAGLLALRYDPTAAIEATADYAKANLQRLRRSGVVIGDSADALARTAYLAHHLGPGDAVRFLKGGLGDERAARLLRAQVGEASADRRIAASGQAASAHREWLMSYVGRHIRPDRFEA